METHLRLIEPLETDTWWYTMKCTNSGFIITNFYQPEYITIRATLQTSLN
jgi:hypothetical protein